MDHHLFRRCAHPASRVAVDVTAVQCCLAIDGEPASLQAEGEHSCNVPARRWMNFHRKFKRRELPPTAHAYGTHGQYSSGALERYVRFRGRALTSSAMLL